MRRRGFCFWGRTLSNQTFHIVKADDEQRIVFGLACVSVRADGEVVTDLQGDQIPPEVFEKAFYQYALDSRDGDVMHDQKPVSKLVELFVVTPTKINSLLKAFGVEPLADFKGVAAWVAFKVYSEDAWARVKSGKLRAFSIEAEAMVRQVAA